MKSDLVRTSSVYVRGHRDDSIRILIPLDTAIELLAGAFYHRSHIGETPFWPGTFHAGIVDRHRNPYKETARRLLQLPWRYESSAHAQYHYNLMEHWPRNTHDENYPWLSTWSHRTLLELFDHGPLGTRNARPCLSAGDRQVQQLSFVLDCVRACDFESRDLTVPASFSAEARPSSLSSTSSLWPILEADADPDSEIGPLRELVDDNMETIMREIRDGSHFKKTDTPSVWHPVYDTRKWAIPGASSHTRNVRRRRA